MKHLFTRVLPVTLILLTACHKKVYTQQFKSFSNEPAVFITEFSQFIKQANQPKVNEELEKFSKNWQAVKFTEDQQRSIIRLCNNMLDQKMTVQPYFELVLKNLNAYVDNGLSAEIIAQWQSITKNLLGKDPKEYLSFLETCNRLFSQNVLFEDNGKKWYSNNNLFEISYDKQIAITFKALELTCETTGDQMRIYNTSGTYYPDKTLWVSKGGSTTWERVGLGPEEISAQLPQYKIDFSKGEYQVDSVLVNFPKYFAGGGIYGKFVDKISNTSNPEEAKKSPYPQFTTYKNDLEIKGIIGDKATYTGGLRIKGREISSENTANQEAVVTIYFKGNKKVIAKSKSFRIEDGSVQSLESSLEIYNDSGSIYHPRIIFNFNYRDGKMLATKGETGMMKAYFTDAYHRIDFDVQQVRWKIEEPLMDFDMSSDNNEAKFQSESFFRDFIYEKIQGMLSENPLELIQKYFAQTRQKKFALNDYAAWRRNTRENLLETIINLADGGYIFYYQNEDSVEIRPKLLLYVQAHRKSKDYDVIRLSSVIAARPNATLNLFTNELKVEGVPQFGFSDSQNVIVVPYEQQVSFLKNRRIRFGGMIRAGRFDFYGRKFEFDYENFKILYSNIDSMRLYFPDSTGRKIEPVKSVLHNIYGTLLIDKPTNKSGLANYPEYPVFISDKGSEITYDKPSIHNGAYKAETFRFEVDPFTIDSLDNFTLSGLQFDGTFKSDGIFPDFRYKATIQKDFSLGFVKKMDAGTPMYRGKGTGDMTISLSEQGLYGKGSINYLGSTIESDQFLLLPKKMQAKAKEFTLPHGVKYPQVNASNAFTEWNPYDEQLTVTKGETPLKVFKMGYDFDGSITVSPSNLKGNGTLNWAEASFTSKEQILGPNKTTAKSAALKIRALDTTKVAFQTSDVNGTIDFDKREGKFTSNLAGSSTMFPSNMYATNLNDYKWNMDAKTIEVKPAAGLSNPYFVSTHPNQDSLKFECKKGLYDLTTGLLKLEQIPYIDVADSRVFPGNGKAIIRLNADMDPLDSSRILANRTDKFHDIYKCYTKISGKNAMRARGKYQYENKLGVKQEVFLDSIVVTREKLVSGNGKIEETQAFTLDTKIGYKGFAKIMSNEKPIEFTGYVKAHHTFKNMPASAWIRFKDKVDPKNVIVNVSDPRDKDNKRQFTGVYFANDTTHVYPLLFAQKRKYSDDEIHLDTGIMFYDQTLQAFKVGSKAKLIDNELHGSYIMFSEKDHSVYAEGPLDMGFDNKDFKFLNAGTAQLKAGDSSFSFDVAFIMDFPLPKAFGERMAELANGSGNGPVNNNNDFVKKAIGEMISDNKTAKAVIKGIEKNGQIDTKGEADAKLVVSHADFMFDAKKRGLAGESPIDIATIGGVQVNKTFKSNILIEHRRSGENMYMYIELDNSNWVYFNLARTTMYIVSSDQKLNDIITNEGSKVSTETFNVRNASMSMKDKFLRKFE